VLIGGDFCFDRNQRRVLISGLSEAIDEVKTRSRDGEDSASATVLVLPTLYSTEKSKASSLPTQWCCGMVAKR
jgi:hypothetical protein